MKVIPLPRRKGVRPICDSSGKCLDYGDLLLNAFDALQEEADEHTAKQLAAKKREVNEAAKKRF